MNNNSEYFADVSGKRNEKTKSLKNTTKSALSLLHDLSYLLAGILLVFLLMFRVVVVSGSSMKDTLVDGDYILLLNNTFCGAPETGDVIVASKDAYKDGEPIIKRVIATEGQTVRIETATGLVYVNDVLLDEPYLNKDYIKNYYIGINESYMEATVEEGCVFVMGDNRGNSLDSRSDKIGQIDEREILGKAIVLFIPGADPVTKERDFGRIGGVD